MSAAFATEEQPVVSADDADFLSRFENCELPERDWTHLAHVRVAWICLQLEPAAEALERVRSGILRYNTSVLRRPQRYHDTVTVAFTCLIHARMRPGERWRDFADRIDDLLDRDEPVLHRHYSPEVLASEGARTRFLPADRAPLPQLR